MNTTINRSMQGAVAALAVLLGTSAVAQQDSASKQPEKTSKQGTAQGQQKQLGKQVSSEGTKAATGKKPAPMAPAVVVGDIVEMRTSNLKGREGAQRLIKVEMQDGNTAIVDAGAAEPTAEAVKDLQTGDRIVAVGRAGRINDRPVLVARSIGELYATGVTGSKKNATAGSGRGSD